MAAEQDVPATCMALLAVRQCFVVVGQRREGKVRVPVTKPSQPRLEMLRGRKQLFAKFWSVNCFK
eukprot:731444-Pelagomonas_calceolata.AAC.10